MTIPKVVLIPCGKKGVKRYFYWDEYDTIEEAIYYAKKIKLERKEEMCIKYYITETKDSWFLPVTKYVVYLNKKMRLF